MKISQKRVLLSTNPEHEPLNAVCFKDLLVYYYLLTSYKDVSHPLGRGDIIPSFPKCIVKFRTFIPKDIEKHPYAIFYSRGTHNHPPPPPSKPPHQLMEEVWNLFA